MIVDDAQVGDMVEIVSRSDSVSLNPTAQYLLLDASPIKAPVSGIFVPGMSYTVLNVTSNKKYTFQVYGGNDVQYRSEFVLRKWKAPE